MPRADTAPSARLATRAHEPPLAKMLLAFGALYLIWGSTYLAIRFAIETIPPLLMGSLRFALAGVVLYAWARASGVPRPSARQWKAASIVGALLLVVGNGGVVLAEQWVPSGLASLMIAAVPLWMVVLDWAWGSRVRPTRRVAVGLVAGFGGVAVLAVSPDVGLAGPGEAFGAFLLLIAAFSWAAGSIYSRSAPAPSDTRLWGAMQMLCGSGLLLGAAIAAGELGRIDPGAVSLLSALSVLYLTVFGSLVAFSAYVWLLQVSTPARVGTYTYVNPVVALALGWAFAGEPVTARSMVASAIILGAVVLITTEAKAT
jgi:drug/metabolite transporter (DMT)-like permease